VPTRSLNVVITGDPRGLERATKRASGSLDKLGKDTTLHARVTSKGFAGIGLAARGMAAGVTAGVAGVGFLVKQFEDSNKVARQTQAVLKSTGGAANVTAKQVGDLATAISRKTGIDDEAVQSSENMLLTFTRVRNEAGRGNDIFTRATRTVQDMSVALGQDGKNSAIQLGKALNDPIKGVTALQRVGVTFTAAQRQQIKALEDTGHHLQAQRIILRELNKEFGGSAAAQATPFDKLKVSAGNLAETLGGDLAPALGKAAGFANRFLNQMQDGTGAGGRFAKAVSTAFHTVRDTIQSVVGAVRGYLNRHRQDINSVIAAVRRFGAFAKDVFQNIALPIVRRTFTAMGQIIGDLGHVVRGVVRLVSGLLSGNWSKAWSGAKEAVGGAARAILTTVKTLASNLWTIVKELGPRLVKLIVRGVANLGKALATGIVDGVKAAAKAVPGMIGGVLKGIGGTIASGVTGGIGGKVAGAVKGLFGDGMGGAIPRGGAGGNSLMGAKSFLAPFAGLAARFGLQTTSGLRPGAVTVSGNTSYHASGNAIDESGPPSGMMAFFQFMKSHFGSRLRELIYTPGGVGVKDGHPFRYTGAVAAEHYNHVHVAYTGDGHGRRTGDGLGFRRLEDLWVRAGGPARIAPLMAHVAQAESGGDPSARNPSGASGLWQILGKPFPGNVFDPLTNAKMAVWKYRHQGLGAWAASRASWGAYVNSGETYSPGGAGGGGGSSGGGSHPRPHPAQPPGAGFVQVDVQQNTPGFIAQNAASRNAAAVSFANRQRAAAARGGAPAKGRAIGKGTLSPEARQAIADNLANQPTAFDYLDAALAQAELTPDAGDDRAALQNIANFRSGEYQTALGSGDPRQVAEAARNLKAATDALGSLEDTAKALTDALKGVQAELKAADRLRHERVEHVELSAHQDACRT
jgi:hypothetical protein